MHILLYVKRLLIHKKSIFISLLITCTLTFATAMLPLIYIDTETFLLWLENQVNVMRMSEGSHLVIHNAKAEYLDSFSRSNEYTARYAHNRIYITINRLETEGDGDHVWSIIRPIVSEIDNHELEVETFYQSFLRGPSQPASFYSTIAILVVVFLAVSLAAFTFAFTDFIRKQWKDLASMISIGASHRQIGTLLLVEITPIFLLSLLLGAVMSNALMSLAVYSMPLLKQLQDTGRIFFMNGSSLLLSVVLLTVTTAVAFIVKLSEIRKISPIKLSAQSEDIDYRFTRNENILKLSSASGALTRINIVRDNKLFIRMLLLSSMVFFSVFFLPSFTYNSYKIVEQGYPDILLERKSWSGGSDQSQISQEDEQVLRQITSEIPGIEHVSVSLYALVDNNAVRVKEKSPGDYTYNNKFYRRAIVKVIDDFTLDSVRARSKGNLDEYKNKDYVLLPIENKSEFRIGDKLELARLVTDPVTGTKDYAYASPKILTVAGFVDIEGGAGIVTLLFSLENFVSVTKGEYLFFNARVFLKDEKEAPAMTSRLQEYLDAHNTGLTATDMKPNKLHGYNFMAWINHLTTALCLMLLGVVYLILWICITSYFSGKEEQIRTLIILGADIKDIKVSHLRQSLFYALLSSIPSMILGVAATLALYRANHYWLAVDFNLILVCLVVLMLSVLAYALPTYAAVGKIIKRHVRETNGDN